MIEHLPKETEIVRSLLQQAREDFSPEVHKALSNYVLGEEATNAAAGFVDVIAPKIVELLERAKGAASLPAFLAGDNIYDDNGVPTIVVREGLGVWGTIGDILDDQVIDLYLGTDNQEDFAELYDALDGLESIRFRKLRMYNINIDFKPETIRTVKIVSTADCPKVMGDPTLNYLTLHAPIETCVIYDRNFVASPNTADTWAEASREVLFTPRISNSANTTLDLTRTSASWHNFRYVKSYGNAHPIWDWMEPGWHTVLCPDGTITHDDNGDIVLRQEA